MAITVEQIQTAIAGDGEVTDSIKDVSGKLLQMFDDDVIGLKQTNAALKSEKTEMKAKWDADVAKMTGVQTDLQNQLNSANEQLKKQSPEETQRYLENQIGIVESGYKSQLAEKDTSIADLTKQIEGYKKREVYSSMQNEFRRVATKANVASDSMDIVENFILGPDGANFAPRDTSEGRVFWSTDNSGDTIDTRLDKFLKTPGGKRFLPFNSTGSGAEGGIGGAGNGSKTLTMAEFNKLSPADKASRMREGYKITN